MLKTCIYKLGNGTKLLNDQSHFQDAELDDHQNYLT